MNMCAYTIEMFKVKNNLCPEIMKKIFHLNPDSKLGKSFFRPNVNTVNKGEGSLRSFGPIILDSMLPESLKIILTLEKFKEQIKKWVPENCVCRLCKEYIRGLGFVTLFD